MGTSALLGPLARSRYMALETKRRDGSWVVTPVNLVVDGPAVVFRTWSTSGKAKRLANFSEVRIAPCTARGRATGDRLAGQAVLEAGEDDRRAAELVDRRYPILHGVLVPLTHRVRGYRTVHYRIEQIAAA